MEKEKSNGKGKVGSVEVSMTREDFNSLVKFLDLFLAAGSENRYAQYATNLKEKMLRHSRRYTHENENKTVTYITLAARVYFPLTFVKFCDKI